MNNINPYIFSYHINNQKNTHNSDIYMQEDRENEQKVIINAPHTGNQHYTALHSINKDSLDDLSNAFSKMNIAGGSFSEIFLYFFKTQPNTLINFIPTKYIKCIEGSTKFNSKYEQEFIKQIYSYNTIHNGKYFIEYKKEKNNQFDFYNCNYTIRFVLKKQNYG